MLTVVNDGAVACRLDVGTANRGFLVTSGNDRIWSSADCTKTSPNVATFKPGESVSYSHTGPGSARRPPAARPRAQAPAPARTKWSPTSVT